MCALGSVSGWDQDGVVCWKFLGPGVLKLREEGCGLFGVCAKPWMTRVTELPLVADKDSALFIRPRGSRLAGERVPGPCSQCVSIQGLIPVPLVPLPWAHEDALSSSFSAVPQRFAANQPRFLSSPVMSYSVTSASELIPASTVL